MAKETLVKLKSKHGEEREFSITHAQNLLDYEKKIFAGNWELNDSNFTLDNGTIKRTDTGDSKESATKEPANTSDKK